MAKFAVPLIGQHRHQFVVPRFECGIGIDVEYRYLEMRHARLAAQGFQRGKHVVAQMAVVAPVQAQPRPAIGNITYRTPP